MQTDTGYADRERLLAILDFWHKIEFFIPYDLSSRAVQREGRSVFWLHAQTLEDDAAALRRPSIPEEKEVAGITLFLGVFHKSEVAGAGRFFGDGPAQYEDAERGDLDGDTCFASLELDASGNPLFETFAISTLPWALGRSRELGLSALDFGAFTDSRRRLSELLQNLDAQRRLDLPPEDKGDRPFMPREILGLHELLCDWAGFIPKHETPVALVEIRYRDRRAKAVRQALPPPEGETTTDDDDDGVVAEKDIGILNSFFIEDIEQAMAQVRAGTVPEPLKQYLTPRTTEERIDLYSDEGRHALLDILNPRNLNCGRWPSELHQAMSLMQQFAINSATLALAESGLYSVNGPPGTGKTTLLREMIANNVVKRARVLAALKTPRDAFDGRPRSIAFADGSTASLSVLKPELAGFEMVVASSNNTAVENISHDLPKRRSIVEISGRGYLQTVAHKIAAQKDNGHVLDLTDDDRPWGLIACALGKAGNRRAFKERFAFMPVDEEARPTWSGPEKPQTIWQWLKSYEGPSFAEAAQRFRAADDAVSESVRRHVRYADLHREVGLVPLEEFCRELRERTQAAADVHRRAWESRDAAFAEVTALEERLSHLQEEEHLLDRSAPGWWQSVLPTAVGREHRNSRAANLEQQLSLGRKLREAEQRLAEQQARARKAGQQYKDCRQRLCMQEEAWSTRRAEFEKLAKVLGHPAVPLRLEELESDRFQIDGLWHSDELARLRTALFEAALALHEAWLADVGSKGGGFGGNIVATVKLLSGNDPLKRDHLPSIWQSLFMMVPVVSTTFASFARQFGGLGPGSIGWLFVDEAGQAVPQAAVGALMRAKRAMMIGDPLQIEPVFSLPSALIGALAALSPHTSDGHYAPNRVSAQILADAANRFGTTIPADGGEGLWIGSPLRVHRRCIDPMFSLANRIAYRNKMVFAAGAGLADEDAAPFRNDSAWIDIKGKVSGKQTVAGQVDFIVDVLAALYRRDGILPESYVISPFKETKNALKQALLQASWSDTDRYSSPPKLHRWLQDRIGTVHTFQGKEESAVFMVLGTDADHVGAAVWASSKPNLLNVAATRARRRFYIVADRNLWQGMPHFREAAKALKTIRATEFLARL
ncbi:ATP-binding protein [Ensifer sp. LCM 4579]|uniref:DEAD/DEAH box helicase n=1 Tax=Ensifer sp. LCM 4579 TaxID=1848292 RepID=UPI0008DA645C|nr:AAA domain-containing protein [Ensifer sp. LCM 4579]OHV82354.1 hypothetical protein LCM4579_17430 [Ensifer sp. LCM 4579]